MEKELTRETVDPRYTWDLTRIYASDEAWEEAFADARRAWLPARDEGCLFRYRTLYRTP